MFNQLIEPLMTTEWGRRAGWSAMIGGSLLLVYLFTSTLSTWYGDLRMTSNQKHVTKNISAVDEVTKLIATLPDQHLFGKQGVIEQNAYLPVTSLQLRLVGVIKTESEKFSRVIISEAGQLAKVYQVGDSLSSGVRINAITQDGVILENSGHLEKLPLQRPKLSFNGMPKSLLPQEG